MEKTMKNLPVTTKANDVDEQGRVTVAVNRTGIEDSQGDISMPGSFDATLITDLPRMKWLYNHDWTQLLGVPLEGSEKNGDLIMVGQLNMNKQLCRDVYTDYKLMAEYGRTLEHSVGVIAIERDKTDRRKVLQWKMLEYSTLSFLGANPCTFLVDIKGASRQKVKEAAEFLQKALCMPEYSDYRLKDIDMRLQLMLRKLNGGNIVTCPHCGESFDADEQFHHTFTQEVLDNAAMFVSWIASDCVYDHVQSMKPEIEAEVGAIIDTIKSLGLPMEEKSITAVMNYVRCPYCWGKVFDSEVKVSEVSEKEDEGNETPKGKGLKSLLEGINNKINL